MNWREFRPLPDGPGDPFVIKDAWLGIDEEGPGKPLYLTLMQVRDQRCATLGIVGRTVTPMEVELAKLHLGFEEAVAYIPKASLAVLIVEGSEPLPESEPERML